VEIDDGMNAHHFLRREHFLAGVETGVENVKIKEFRKAFVDKPGEMAVTVTVGEEQCKFRRRAGIEICP
jgi:hypothetical protein